MTRRATVLAVEPLACQRVVADRTAIDALIAALPAQASVLRLAPDEALVIGVASIHLDDLHAIVVDEAGFVAIAVDPEVVARHAEWPVPRESGAFAQGAIAGVPAKLASTSDGHALVIVHAAYADELLERLR
jgi:hypothetical protein